MDEQIRSDKVVEGSGTIHLEHFEIETLDLPQRWGSSMRRDAIYGTLVPATSICDTEIGCSTGVSKNIDGRMLTSARNGSSDTSSVILLDQKAKSDHSGSQTHKNSPKGAGLKVKGFNLHTGVDMSRRGKRLMGDSNEIVSGNWKKKLAFIAVNNDALQEQKSCLCYGESMAGENSEAWASSCHVDSERQVEAGGGVFIASSMGSCDYVPQATRLSNSKVERSDDSGKAMVETAKLPDLSATGKNPEMVNEKESKQVESQQNRNGTFQDKTIKCISIGSAPCRHMVVETELPQFSGEDINRKEIIKCTEQQQSIEKSKQSPLKVEAHEIFIEQQSTSKKCVYGESFKELQRDEVFTPGTEARQLNVHEREEDGKLCRELHLSFSTQPEGTNFKKCKILSGERQCQGSKKNESGDHLKDTVTLMSSSLPEKIPTSFDLCGSSINGHNQKMLKVESVHLTLALPHGSTVSNTYQPPPLPGPAGQESFQSASHNPRQNVSQTGSISNSDGFTTSFSLTHSQSFIHNASCSLNLTSYDDQEHSCGGSRQTVNRHGHMSHVLKPVPSQVEQMSNGLCGDKNLIQDKSKLINRLPLCPPVVQSAKRENYEGHLCATRTSKTCETSPFLHRKCEVNSQSEGRQGYTALNKEHQHDICFKGTKSETPFQLVDSSLFTAYTTVGNREVVRGESVPVIETVALYDISIEPIADMACKLQNLPEAFLDGLRYTVKDLLGSIEKREEFLTLQNIVHRRTDLTEETLLDAHCTQLEILVALKTGMQDFVNEGPNRSSCKVLREILLQMRCRNLECQQSLPVDGCECKICTEKGGFCHECMCMVCSKFDSVNNTCYWVGCDVCMHWCHTDCGLRMSYIMPAQTSQSQAGSSEMQFQCIACGHYMELFGFVRAVFEKFAGVWDSEAVAKELDCVRKIFHRSKDMKGKQLCWMAERMLQKLENKAGTADVCRDMLLFFNEGKMARDGVHTSTPNKDLNPAEESFKDDFSKSKLSDVCKALQPCYTDLRKKGLEAAELQLGRAHKAAQLDDIERIMKLKKAEATMFEARAIEAREDAAGLQDIVSLKREKIEADFSCKYAKLSLDQAELRRRKYLEELQLLERAQIDYERMRIRIETDMKHLLMKIDMAKPQLA